MPEARRQTVAYRTQHLRCHLLLQRTPTYAYNDHGVGGPSDLGVSMHKDGVRYELKTVKAMRGTEARSIARLQKDGWELVDQTAGAVRATLNFRRRKPPLPVRQLVVGGAVALVLSGIIGVGAVLERTGDGGDPVSTQPTPESIEASEAPTTAPAPADLEPAKPTLEAPEQSSRPPSDITVDELLDRLNSANMGDIVPGDQFRLTGRLVASDYWGVGASGDFFVYLEAKGGADDLMVFVNEVDADGWQNGTAVGMVVESVKVTINGETSDGWLRAQSVETVANR